MEITTACCSMSRFVFDTNCQNKRFVGLCSRLFTGSVVVCVFSSSISSTMSYKEANDVLNYWFGGGDRSKRPRWFRGGEEAAQEIRDKFETLVSE